MAGHLSQSKAREILRDGSVRGNPLTEKQKGFFGARVGGVPVKAKNNPDEGLWTQSAKRSLSEQPHDETKPEEHRPLT